jgi:hypothetical protein
MFEAEWSVPDWWTGRESMSIGASKPAMWLVFVSLGLGVGSTSQALELAAEREPDGEPYVGGTSLATMPDLGGGSGFSPAPSPTLNLNGFDIVIVPNASLSGNAAALAAFNRAAQAWEAFIADPITVTINANLAALGSGVIGSANPTLLKGSYTTVRNAMELDAGNETDDAITAFLPTAAQASFLVPTNFALDGQMQLTKANAKALGFTNLDAQFGVSDGNITFSSNFAFDYDNSDGVTPGTMDFETVAAHEIGHALGFLSDVDYVDAVVKAGQTATDVEPTPLDLFRFRDNVAGQDPSTAAEFTTFPRSMLAGSAAITDELTPLGLTGGEALMSTGAQTGDGRQASHWKDNNLTGLLIGMLDPTLSNGQVFPVTTADLRAFDLIGYEITLIPEPASAALLAAGGLMLLRRRRA